MKSDTYLTPPEWIKALGPFDIDPCCPPMMPWKTAEEMLSLPTDGLSAPWNGRMWLNPPFGQKWLRWMRRLAQEHRNGIGLIAARTETTAFYSVLWGAADALCFVKGRPHFYRLDGTPHPFNSGAPIVLAAYGQENVAALYRANLGVVVEEWTMPACATCKSTGQFCIKKRAGTYGAAVGGTPTAQCHY